MCPHPAETVVLQLDWHSARYSSLLSGALLRDFLKSQPIPPERSTVQIRLLAKYPVSFTVVKVSPPHSPIHGPLVATASTHIFVIPALPPSLDKNFLVSLSGSPSALTDGAQLPSFLRLALSPHSILSRNALHSNVFLVHSPHGYGKTSTIVAAAHAIDAAVIRIQPSHLLPHVGTPKDLISALLKFLRTADAAAPALLLLDDAQFLFPDDQPRFACAFPPFVDEVRRIGRPIAVVICVSPHISAIHPIVTSSVDNVLPLRVVSTGPYAVAVAAAHASIPSDVIFPRLSKNPPHSSIAHVVEWARRQPPELNRLLSNNPCFHHPHQQSLPTFSPSLTLTEKWHLLSTTLPALGNALTVLQRALLWPLIRAETLKRLNIQPLRAVLLYGAPGTGKTVVVKAAATAAGYNIVVIDAAEVAHGEVGAAEERLESIFKSAQLQFPSLIFLDEVDALFGTGRGSTGESSASLHSLRLVGALSRCLQSQPDGIVTVAVTNRPWVISRSLLRPGRFDYCIRVHLPDAPERAKIARVFAERMGLSQALHQILVDLAYSSKASGLSGADIAGTCRRAVMAAVSDSTPISEENLVDAFEATTPSVTVCDARRIHNWYSTSSLSFRSYNF